MDASPGTAPAPDDVLGPWGAHVPFRVRGRAVTLADVLAAMALRGAWADVVLDAGRGEQALAGADEGRRADLAERLPALESALRRRLGLTAADDYLAWLGRHGLTVDDCREHLRCLLAQDGAAPTGRAAGSPTAVRAHLVLDGLLEAEVRRLAEDAALADADPGSPDWLAQVVARASEERVAEPDPGLADAVISEHSVGWTRVEGTVALVADDDVAHELLLCVREQHAPLASVAAEVGVATQDLRTTMDDVEPWLEPVLVGAEPGSLLGPVPHAAGRAVVQVVGRHHPSSADEESRRLAQALLLQRRIATAMSALVRWSPDA